MKNKRGLAAENIIFIVLNLVFFIVLLVFISSSSGGRAVLQQKYAKQIALMIDEAKPESTIMINMEDAFKIAEKNKIPKENVVIIDNDEKKVILKLGSSGGYSYNYFSDIKISTEFKENKLIIYVKNE